MLMGSRDLTQNKTQIIVEVIFSSKVATALRENNFDVENSLANERTRNINLFKRNILHRLATTKTLYQKH